MSQFFINGAKYAFSTIAGAAVNITAISNAIEAVVAGASAPDDGSIVLLRSNWPDLNDQATYTKGKAGNNFTLSHIDTTDVSLFQPTEELPASYQVLSGFTNISQIRDIQQSGGDTNQFTWGYIDRTSPRQMSKPTDQNPLILTFTMDYDPSMAWDAALEKVSNARQMVCMRERLPTGDVLLYTGYISYQKSPTRVRNENMTVSAVMSINSEVLRFPASDFSS